MSDNDSNIFDMLGLDLRMPMPINSDFRMSDTEMDSLTHKSLMTQLINESLLNRDICVQRIVL